MGSVLGVGDPRVTATRPLSLLLNPTHSMADTSTTDTTRDSNVCTDKEFFHPDIDRNAIIVYSTARKRLLAVKIQAHNCYQGQK